MSEQNLLDLIDPEILEKVDPRVLMKFRLNVESGYFDSASQEDSESAQQNKNPQYR